MKTKKQELVGVFTVVTNKQELKQVVVSQDIISYYRSETNHTKNLHLDSINGPEVYKTNDPEIFMLPDGTTLRKINTLRSKR